MPISEKEIYSKFCMIERDTTELRHDYYGNGRKGTKIEVAEMKKDFENYKNIVTSKLKANTTITTLVLIALIGNLVRSFF